MGTALGSSGSTPGVERGVKQLSRAGIQCGTIPVITFPISRYKICVGTGVETWKAEGYLRETSEKSAEEDTQHEPARLTVAGDW